jgi:hypothetical protein
LESYKKWKYRIWYSQLTPYERYKLFTLLIVPRPQNKTIYKIYDYNYTTKFIFFEYILVLEGAF